MPFDTVPFDTVEAICDPKRCPTPQALEAAFRIAADKPEFAADLAAALGVDSTPAANPTAAIAEHFRREDIRDAAGGSSTGISVEESNALKEKFHRTKTGFFIVNHANLEYPSRCMVPNIRVVDFFPAASQNEADVGQALNAAKRRVQTLSKDKRLKRAIHNIVPANMPHLIPYSEATALAASHVLSKINRNANRHVQFNQYRMAEFKAHVETKTPGETELSEYHRWKTYLSKRRTLRLSSPTAAPAVEDGDEITAADALREAAASGREVIQKLSGGQAAMDFVPAAPLPGLEAFMSPNAAPAPLLSTEETNALGWGNEAGAGTADEDNDDILGEWPRDLERRASFVNLSIVDDLDVAADSPEFPGAAGMEPLVILFGGIYETEEEAKSAAKDSIAPWAQDLKIDTVCMYVHLFPTEVDPDRVAEEHRTGNSGNDAEMKLVMDQNKLQKKNANKARSEAASRNLCLPETNANAALPDVDDVVARNRAAMSFAGDVVQLPREVQAPAVNTLPEL